MAATGNEVVTLKQLRMWWDNNSSSGAGTVLFKDTSGYGTNEPTLNANPTQFDRIEIELNNGNVLMLNNPQEGHNYVTPDWSAYEIDVIIGTDNYNGGVWKLHVFYEYNVTVIKVTGYMNSGNDVIGEITVIPAGWRIWDNASSKSNNTVTLFFKVRMYSGSKLNINESSYTNIAQLPEELLPETEQVFENYAFLDRGYGESLPATLMIADSGIVAVKSTSGTVSCTGIYIGSSVDSAPSYQAKQQSSENDNNLVTLSQFKSLVSSDGGSDNEITSLLSGWTVTDLNTVIDGTTATVVFMMNGDQRNFGYNYVNVAQLPEKYWPVTEKQFGNAMTFQPDDVLGEVKISTSGVVSVLGSSYQNYANQLLIGGYTNDITYLVKPEEPEDNEISECLLTVQQLKILTDTNGDSGGTDTPKQWVTLYDYSGGSENPDLYTDDIRQTPYLRITFIKPYSGGDKMTIEFDTSGCLDGWDTVVPYDDYWNLECGVVSNNNRKFRLQIYDTGWRVYANITKVEARAL